VNAAGKSDLFRRIPSVDDLLRGPQLERLIAEEGSPAVADATRTVLSRLREEITAGGVDSANLELALQGLPQAIERQLRQELSYSLRCVVNATGVILHTNLGRAPLGAAALHRIRETAAGYSNLEFEVSTGDRGKRDVHIERLFQKLLAREGGGSRRISTIVVNNNAAAVLLALNTLAEGGEVVVSRGELVEIGGSFRIPDVMSKSGATLREVGTTNRTRISDYEDAINEKTRLLLRVHRSNFETTGFTEQPAVEQLVELGIKRGLPLMEDLGSGALFDLRTIGISGEPGVLDSLRQGVDVVTYSGDKLLGGPQAGMLTGETGLIQRMRGNSLFRALRVDKLTYAALEATLLSYVKRDYDAVPVLRMMSTSKEDIGARAEVIAAAMRSSSVSVDIGDGESVIGGGAAPSAVLPTRVIALTVESLSANQIVARLRAGDPPIIARVEDGRVLLDLRTVFPEQDDCVAKAVQALASV
jgi:L-seryl-tRNA(Ser) seleniumtransferase